jgi:hypothetical protein
MAVFQPRTAAKEPEMSLDLHARPLPFDPAAETPQPREAEAIATLRETMRGIQETTFADYGHAVRSVHAKSHGLLEGELQVLDSLPPELAQGLFARPARYPVVLRLSSIPGDVMDDSISSPRGLALKVIGVPGERLADSAGESTQDFLMANAPAFAAPGPAAFATNLKLLAATTDTGQAWKKAFSAVLRGAEATVEAMGGKSAMLTTMGGQPLTHPLGETFYTQVPFRYGAHVAKLSVAPSSPALKALAGVALDVGGRPNALREAVIDFFRDHDAEWELRVQLRTNAETMPVEDASVAWPEEESPYRTVARITVPRQPAWNEARARAVDDSLSFSPWHGLAAHQPLGAMNRARRGTYQMAASFRAERNRCPIHEPAARLVLPGAPAAVFGTAPGREGRRPGTPDALPGAWTQPMSEGARHMLAGAAGGLAGGVILSAVIAGMGAREGGPSELGRLERRAAERLGVSHRREGDGAATGEELSAHAGHLALSALAGAGYGLVTRNGTASPALAGLAFGLGFHVLAYGVVGPALGVTPKPWRDTASNQLQHAALHAIFGVVAGVVTEGLARRPRAR